MCVVGHPQVMTQRAEVRRMTALSELHLKLKKVSGMDGYYSSNTKARKCDPKTYAPVKSNKMFSLV